MVIDDHINLQPDNPLRGENFEALGPRFPDMSQPYSKRFNELLQKIAKAKKIKLNKGVYAAVMGPNLETGGPVLQNSRHAADCRVAG